MAIQNGKNITIDYRCDFTSNNDPNSLIYVLRSNFYDFKNESNGGAIYIKNSGFLGNFVNFTKCISNNGGGGAIYIKNSHALNNNVILENITFSYCVAAFGGACYIYQNSEENNVLILFCTFENNKATKKKPIDKNDELFGGSSVFLSARNGNVTKSKFITAKGEGTSLKIYNKFYEDSPDASKRKSRILEENQNYILIIKKTLRVQFIM